MIIYDFFPKETNYDCKSDNKFKRTHYTINDTNKHLLNRLITRV